MIKPGVMAFSCDPATLEAKFQNGMGSVTVGGGHPFSRWVDCVTTCNPAQGDDPD